MAEENPTNSLAFSLLKKLFRDDSVTVRTSGFVISPLSLRATLAMLSTAATGGTRMELLKLLGVPNERTLDALYTDLLSKKDLSLKVAKKFLADQDCVVHPGYEAFLKVSDRCPESRSKIDLVKEIVPCDNLRYDFSQR